MELRHVDGKWSLLADGVDIINAVSAMTLQADAETRRPTLHLELLGLRDIELHGVPAVIPPAVRDALVALGWTPPPDAD